MSYVLAVLTGGIGAVIVKAIVDYFADKRKRKIALEDKKTDSTEARLKTIEDQLYSLKEASKFLLYDRIRYLGQCYVRDKEIDIDDRRILNEMHRVYHNGLSGNGDLELLMREVNSLPLAKEGQNVN